MPTPEIVYAIMRGGRARSKMENETFNILKNQGYNLEHDYGYGEQNLSAVLMMLESMRVIPVTRPIADPANQRPTGNSWCLRCRRRR